MDVRTWAVVLAIGAVGCGGADAPAPIGVGTQPLAGVVAGSSWTFVAGDTNAYLSDGDDLFTKLYASSYPDCGSAPFGEDHLLLSIPKQVGDYVFSLQRNGTFAVGGSDNLVTTRGRLIVESVDASSVTARVHMIFDGGNEVDGRFTATVCP